MASRSLLSSKQLFSSYFTRCYSGGGSALTNSEVRKRRNALFNEEKERQLSHVTRVEKIKVEVQGPPDPCTLIMNKDLSTPYNCAMHIAEILRKRSVLALVNSEPWDMHRPLVEDCTVEFLHFKDEDPKLSNEAFWRSGSFLLGHALEVAFKDNHYVELCSFPKPNITSGSFVHDVDLKFPDWEPTQTELRTISRIIAQLGHEDYHFERLSIDASKALDMFKDNRFKEQQIPSIAAQSESGNDVILYRMADHIDISRGPMISSTQHLARFNVAAVHDIESPEYGKLQRVQGIAIPMGLQTHFWTYEFLTQRAAEFNKSAQIPRAYTSHEETREAVSVAQ